MPHAWGDIERHFLEAADYMSDHANLQEAMSGLVGWISENDVSKFLFGQTSMHDLRIFQTDFEGMPHHSSQCLRISPNFKTKKIEFWFEDTQIEDRQWSRIEPPHTQALINRLVGFLNQVGWTKNLVL